MTFFTLRHWMLSTKLSKCSMNKFDFIIHYQERLSLMRSEP